MFTVNNTEEQITKNIVTHELVLDFIQFSPAPLSRVWQCDHHAHFFDSYLPINCISFMLIMSSSVAKCLSLLKEISSV